MKALKSTIIEFERAARLKEMSRYGGPIQPDLSSTAQLLVAGGDDRILPDATRGLNKYGCRALPDTELAAFASSTASVISEPAFAAAERVRQRLLIAVTRENHAAVYTRELNRVRRELVELCGVADLTGLEVVFAASGTDIHLIASQLAGGSDAVPTLAIMIDPMETGACVPSALSGRHFSTRTALGERAVEGAAMAGSNTVDVASLPVRLEDGTPRPAAAIDAEVEALATAAVAMGRRVFLVLVDVSKTGIIAPSPACVLGLRRRFPDQVEVLVDACQFRITPSTLRAYLEHGCMVALTGSKFVTGPTFSGALLFPAAIARRLRCRLLPNALRSYSARGDWPSSWVTAEALNNVANFGLLLRWEAALQELRAFRAVPETEVAGFLQDFARVIQARLSDDPVFAPLAVPRLDRSALSANTGWDQMPTIFPFVLYHHSSDGKQVLTREETTQVYRLLQMDLTTLPDCDGIDLNGGIASFRCHLGQPVACGKRDGIAVSALRLCVSARMIVEATSGNSAAVMARSLTALDKVALLVKSLPAMRRESWSEV
jgi:hypothetical protein